MIVVVQVIWGQKNPYVHKVIKMIAQIFLKWSSVATLCVINILPVVKKSQNIFEPVWIEEMQ